MLGGVFVGQAKVLLPSDPTAAAGKLSAAEPLLRVGYEGMKAREAAIPPQGKPRLPEALERLVELYTFLERPDEAAVWQRELETRQKATK
jgi:hypothetical protein